MQRAIRHSTIRPAARRQPGVTLEPVTDLHVQIPDDVAKRLKQTAAERGTSAELVAADALASYVKARRPLSFAGKLHSGRGDLSEQVEDILRSDPPL